MSPPKSEEKTDSCSQASDASKAFEADTNRLRELAQFTTCMWGNLNGNPFNQDSESWKHSAADPPADLIQSRDRALVQAFDAVGRIAAATTKEIA